MRSVDFVTLSIFFLFSVMYFWLFKPYRGMSCICCMTNLLFWRKTTLAMLEVEYVERGHYSVALSSTFSGHCTQRQKICRQSYFCEKRWYFSLLGEIKPPVEKSAVLDRKKLYVIQWMKAQFIFSPCEELPAITLLLFSFMPTFVFLFHILFTIFSECFIGVLGGDTSSGLAPW